MFKQISWNSYLIMVLLLTIVYYLFIVLKYYRNDVIKLIYGKNLLSRNISNNEVDQPLLQSFSSEIKAFIYEAGKDQLNIRDMMPSLQILIRKYPGIRDMTMRESIQNLIIHECKTNCSIHLGEHELSELWN